MRKIEKGNKQNNPARVFISLVEACVCFAIVRIWQTRCAHWHGVYADPAAFPTCRFVGDVAYVSMPLWWECMPLLLRHQAGQDVAIKPPCQIRSVLLPCLFDKNICRRNASEVLSL